MSRSKSAESRFDLEVLEPRMLLSADPCGIAPVMAACDPVASPTIIVEDSFTEPSKLSSAVSYGCAAQIDDIFSDASSGFAAEASTAEDGDQGSEVTEEEVDIFASEPLAESALSRGVATANGNPFAEQAVETLRAANGPPGVRLNGEVAGWTDTVLQMGPQDVLSGSGALAASIIVGGTISPGNSPGFLQTGSQTWLAGGYPYDWEINNATGDEGIDPGWDFQRITGTLTLTSTTATKATIRVESLQPNNNPGPLVNFNSANSYTWRILSTTGGITGFSRSVINLDVTNFTAFNSLGTGALFVDISADSHDLLIRFVPVLPNLSFDQPVWTQQGPTYITGNQNSILPPDDPATGAVQAVAVHPADPTVAWVGSVNGGIWRTTTLNYSRLNGINDDNSGPVDDAAETPTWIPQGQNLPSLAITAIAASPFDNLNNAVTSNTPWNQIVLYAGTGSYSSSERGGAAAGLFRSIDGGTTWTEVGNFDGLRATAIVPSAHTPGLVYVGTYEILFTPPLLTARGGLYRSTDSGANWTRITGTGGLPEFHVTDVVQDPSSPSRFYVALAGLTDGLNDNDIGVYRTNNGDSGSVTWTMIVNGMVPDYDHDGVAGEALLNEDLNGNSVWDKLGEDLDGDRILDLGEDTNANGFLDEGEVDFDGNGGVNQLGIAEDLKNAVRIRMSVSKAAGNAVYAAVIGWHDQRLAGVFRSTDTGTTWNRLGIEPKTNFGQGAKHFAIAADPINNNIVYIGGDASFEDPFDGVIYRWDGQWARISAKSAPDPGSPYGATAPHADIRNLAFDAGNNGFMAMTDGGVYRMLNPRPGGGVTWEFIARGVDVAEISSVAYDRNTGTIIAGFQDNGVLAQRPGQATWYGILAGDGNYVGVAYDPFAPNDSTRFYMGNNLGDFYRATYNSLDFTSGPTKLLLEAIDDATDYSGLDNRWEQNNRTDRTFDGFDYIPFALNAVDDLSDGNMKLLLGHMGLYTSDDNGDNIKMVPSWRIEEYDGYITALAYGGRQGIVPFEDIIYVARGPKGEILFSADNGGIFQKIEPPGAGPIHQIAMDPLNYKTAFAVDDQHVWVVTVGGNGLLSVVDVTGNLGEITGGFQSVEVANFNGQLVVLVGARDGVYRMQVADAGALNASPATHAIWNRFGVGMPNAQVADMHYDAVADVLVAGTRGRGAWKITNASSGMLAQPVLRFDANTGNQQVRLILSPPTAAVPRELEFYLGGSLIATYPLTNIQQIAVHLGQGVDILIVDSTEGAVFVPGGIIFDGGDGASDTLQFQGSATSVMESAVQGSVQIRQVGREKVWATNVESVVDNTTQQTLLNSTRNSFQFISDWFSRLTNVGNIPLLNDTLASGLGGGQFTPLVALKDKGKVGLGGKNKPFGKASEQLNSLMTRLLETASDFRIADIGTKILTAIDLQNKLDALDNSPNNVVVDNNTQTITLGTLANPFSRSLSFNAPLDATLLDGLIQLHGSLELRATIDIVMEMGVDARGFYVRTNATTAPEIVIRNIVVNGKVSATGTFGLVVVNLNNATLTLDPDVQLEVNLVESADPYGHAADGKLRVYEFFQQPSALVNVSIIGDPLQDDLRLDGQFTLAVSDLSGVPFLNLGTINLALIWEDINDLGSLRIEATNPQADALMRFLNMGQDELLGEFERLMNALEQIGSSGFLDVKLPFGSGFKLRDVFDFSKGFLDKIYNKIVDIDLAGSTQNVGNIKEGQLNGNLIFDVILDGISTLITVTSASTNNNKNLDDLAEDINAALPNNVATKVRAEPSKGNIRIRLLGGPSPATSVKVTSNDPNSPLFKQLGFGNNQGGISKLKFPSLQSLIRRVQELLPSLNLGLNLDLSTKRFSWNLQFNYTPPTQTTNFAYDTNLNLGDLVETSFSGTLSITGSVGISLTLGLDFGAARAPKLLGSFLVPPPSNGQLISDSSFVINVNDGTRFPITVTVAETAGFTQLSQLVALLNSKLAAYTFNPGTGPISLDRAIHFIQSVYPNNVLAPGIRLEAINEDLDADGQLDSNEDLNANGKLDPGEDVDNDRHLDANEDNVYLNVNPGLFVNTVLDSMLNKVRSLTIEADLNDPIFNEVGFQPGAGARSKIKGIYVDNLVLTGSANVSATNLAANARLALFGLAMSGGTATGAANTTLTFVNPTGGTRIPITQMLGDLRNLSDYIAINPIWNASLDIHLPNLAVTPNIFSNLIPPSAEVRIFVPDVRYVTYNPNPYHPVTNKQGLFVTYPQFGPLSNFSCLDATDFIISLKGLSDQLTKFKAFDFLNKPLPLVNVSISQVIDYAVNFAQTIKGLATANSKTLDQLEATIETLLGIPDNNLNFSVEYATAIPFVTGSTNVSAEYRFNPAGANNALRFVSLAANGASYNGVTFKFVDDGTLTAGANAVVVEDYDTPNKTVTIRYNTTHTTAATIRAAVNAKFLANNVTMPFDAVLDGVDSGNNGSGVVHQTALKMELSYRIQYADSLPFSLGLGDLVNLLPLNSPARTLLDGVADMVTVSASGNLNVTASADLRLVMGIDVSNPCGWKPFFYDSDYNGPNTGTGVNLAASVHATNMNFTAGLGAINISVVNGTATLDADGLPNSAGGDQDATFTVTLKDNNGDGRHYLRSGEVFFNASNIGIDFTAGASVNLPLYALGGSIPLGPSTDAAGDGYPDNNLVVIIPSLKRLFVPETTNNTNQATFILPGPNNDLLFTGPAAGREIKIIDVPGAPSANLSGTRLELNVNSLITTGNQALALSVPAGWSVALSGTDGGNNGSGKVYADLTILTPNVAALFTGFNPCDLLTHAPLLLDGLDGLLGVIQKGLANNILNNVLPMVGDKLGQAANFIEKFRNGLLAKIRSQLAQAGDPIALVKEAIFKSLGAEGLDLIVKSDGSPINTADDVEIECTASALQFKVRLLKSLAIVDTSANPIKFDIGFPALGLSVEGNVKVQIGFDLKLYFGISAADGFYFDTAAAEELRLDFKVTIPGLKARGSLLFLQLDVSDDPDDPSSFEGYFSVDVRGPASHPGKLKFSDFKSSSFTLSDAFEAQLAAEADVNLHLAVSFQGDTDLPRLLADFNLDWSWSLGDSNPTLLMGFNNIQLDAGAFISKLVKGVLDKVQTVTSPLQPVVDMLTTPIPIISDLAGEPIDMLKLGALFGYIKPGTEEFIRDLADIITLINDTSYSDNGSVLIPLGQIELETDELGNVDRAAGDADPEPQPLSEGTSDSGTKNFLKRLEDMGFKFPFLKISEIFKLFRAQPVTLVEYHMPVLEFNFEFKNRIPIYIPLYAVFGGEASVKIDLTFGFDTFGLLKYFNSPSKDILDIADGFFVKDVDDSGDDIPEVVLAGGLFAGVELSFAVAEAGVVGGLYTEIRFNLNDPDDDGKVRLSELIANAKHDVLCIFDIKGEVYVEFTAYLKILEWEKEWDFGRIDLLSFDLICPTPVLANVNGGVLTLHMGPDAEKRIEGDIEDGDESFVVKHLEGGTNNVPEIVEVSFNGIKQIYKGVTSIVADGGEGNDLIDLRGVLSPATVNGGNGNDTIYAGNAGRQLGSIYYGDAGNDRIVAALQKDTNLIVDDEFYGGDGNDTLTSHEGDDWLYGGAGNDTITASSGNDMIWGDAGADTIFGDAGNDMIDGADGNDRIVAGAGNDIITAGNGADSVDAGTGNDWVDGAAGQDFITVGDGNDWVDAGAGNDRVLAGRGDDQVIGGDHNDYIDGGSGSDILLGDFGMIGAAPHSAINLPVSVTNIQGTGNDVLVGGPAVDVLFGAAGKDRIFGGSLLISGQNQISGSAASEYYDDADFVDAGENDDIVFADDARGTPSTIYPGATISGFAWFDLADVFAVVNNVRDNGENGLAGVTVELRRINNTLVGTTLTDVNGNFTFSGLDAGDYYLVFQLPNGLNYAAQNVGSDDAIDSDVDGTGKTGNIHVDEGASSTTHAAGFQNTNPLATLISIDSQSIVEGSSGNTDLIFNVTLSNPSSLTVTVCYETFPGAGARAALRIVDYVTASGTLTFLPGEITKQVRVSIVGDTVYEGDYETFTVMIDTPHNGTINLPLSSGTGTIIEDDSPPVVSVGGARNTEGTNLSFPVRLSHASKFPVWVEYLTSQTVHHNGTLVADGAIATVDYSNAFELIPGTLVFSPGQTELLVTLGTVQDTLDEYDERMNLTISLDTALPSNYAKLGQTVALGFIVDDDATPYARISPVTQTIVEGHAGTTPVFLTISLHDPVTNLFTVSGRPVTVMWNTSSGTAPVVAITSDPVDAEYMFGRVTFAPQTNTYAGDSQMIISVNILGDTRTEPLINGQPEHFFVNLLKADNAVLLAQNVNLNHATIFIQDDEVPDPGPWYVQFDRTDYTVQEGQTLTVRLVAAEDSSFPMAVYWSIGGGGLGQATAGADYTGVWENGTFGARQLYRFAPGQTAIAVTLPTFQDNVYEGDEVLKLYLANPKGGAVRAPNAVATVTIIEDDPVPHIKINDVLPTPESGGPLTFTVTATGDSIVPVTINWQAYNGTAKAPGDFSPTGGSFVIPPFSGTHVVTVNPPQVTLIDDSLPELTEKFYVRLSLPVPDSAIITDYEGAATILDNDPAVVHGFIFMDQNGNGFFDAGNDYGLSGVLVTITDGNGSNTTTTGPTLIDSNGNYNYALTVLLGSNTINLNINTTPANSIISTGSSLPISFLFTTSVLNAPDIGFTIPATDFELPADASLGEGGGDYDDTAYGGQGNDVMHGGAGEDWLIGGHWIWLGPFNSCSNTPYDAIVWNNNGRLFVDPNLPPPSASPSPHMLLDEEEICPDDDLIYGSHGADVILGDFGYVDGAGVEQLLGGDYNDRLYGGNGDDRIYGQGGNDQLPGGLGNDTLVGGQGDELYVYDGDVNEGTDTIIEGAFTGTDTIDLSQTSGWSVTLNLVTPGVQSITPMLSINLPVGDVIENAIGGSRDDVLIGNSQGNRLEGRNGHDTLTGAGGANVLIGGLGSDRYLFDADGLFAFNYLDEVASLATANDVDIIDFTGTTGVGVSVNLGTLSVQTVTGSLNVQLADVLGFENLYGGDAADALTGNGNANIIWGRAGNDALNGGAGNDTLREERGSGFNLTNTTLTVTITGEVDTYSNFENVSLVGDNTSNVMNAAAFTGTVYLDGRGGSDTLTGGSGTNYLTGGAGNDTINGTSGLDIISESRDADFTLTNSSLVLNLFGGGTETDTYSTGGGAIDQAKLTGGVHDNQLNTSAFSGTVVLSGGSGNDTLIATSNDDTLSGEAGNDSLQGGNGNDTYEFDTDLALGTDTVVESVGGGVDTFDFSLTQSAGIIINLGDTSVQNFTGTQVINASLTLILTADVIENVRGGQRDDRLIGNSLANWLEGNNGNDFLTGGLGADVIDGGTGLNANNQPYLDRIIETRDTSALALNNSSLAFAFAETDTLVSIETASLTGGTGNNNLNAAGFFGPVILAGSDGDDILIGGPANDILIGGAGNDILSGNPGNDAYLFDADMNLGSDTISEFTFAGIDTLDFSATTLQQISIDLSLNTVQIVNINLSLTLSPGDELENVIGGPLDDQIIGNFQDNVLIGNDGNDILEGQDGDDTLWGGADNDTYAFDADTPLGTDTILEQAGDGGSDTLDFSATSSPIFLFLGAGGDLPQFVSPNLQLLLLSCDVIENAIGGSNGDFIIGNGLDNRLEGGPGDDMLAGQMGNDTYVFDADVPLGADTLIENADIEGGTDTLDFSSTTSIGVSVSLNLSLQTVNLNLALSFNEVPYFPAFLPYAFENVIGSTQPDFIVGNSLDNVLIGGPDSDIIYAGDGNDLVQGEAGNDLLAGEGGHDRLIGGKDDDTLIGGTGNDIYVFDTDTLISLINDYIFELPAEGADTLDFSSTTTESISINLGSFAFQVVNSNLMLALSADDVIENVIGGSLGDTIEGNSRDNRLFGGPGNDTYLFDADLPLGVDTLVELAGLDTLDFSATTQQISVNLSLTSLQIVDVNLRLILTSALAFENVIGGLGNNILTGNALGNVFNLFPSAGLQTATVIGGGGEDTLNLSAFTANITVNLATIAATQIVAAGDLQLVLPNLDVENVSGGSGSDTLTGNSLANKLTGGDGNDLLTGGTGNDTYLFAADTSLGTDTIVEDATANGGVDMLDFSGTLTQNITVDLSNHSVTPQIVNANLSLLLPGTDLIENAAGGGMDNTLTGNTLNNRLIANGNNNSLIGGVGDDTYEFNMDVITGNINLGEIAGGINTLDFSPTVILQVIMDLTVLDPFNFITRVIGGAANDIITGNSLNNVLSGGGGDDTLNGGLGNDTLGGGQGNDTLNGGANDDTLQGGAGDDVLAGGTGNDIYFYNPDPNLGSDSIVELPAEGIDTIVGINPIGTVNLASGAPQLYYDGNFNLILTLFLINPGQVEAST